MNDPTNPDLEDILTAVNNQVVQLSYRWKIFCQLFDSGPDNIELLNKSGSNVFGLFQRLALDDAIISLSRLTDRARSFGNENASVRTLLQKAKNRLKQDTITEVEDLINELDNYVRDLRKYRNKALAHADLGHALNATALPPVTYDQLENAMKTVQAIVTKVGSEACRSTTHYDPIIPYGRGGDSLLEILKYSHGNDAAKS